MDGGKQTIKTKNTIIASELSTALVYNFSNCGQTCLACNFSNYGSAPHGTGMIA